jgi:tetratricopeptide (TPR) repeat protein
MPEAPRGTVTFLFSDIEHSTRLLQHLGERYAEVLAAYRRLLRQALQAWGGYEIDTAGDGFFAAFQRATHAVAAAVALCLMGRTVHSQGDYRRAIALLEEAGALFRDLGAKQLFAWASIYLGGVAHDQGNDERAMAFLEESVTLFRDTGDKDGLALTLNVLGTVVHARGDDERATALYEESLGLWTTIGFKWGMALALSRLGAVAHAQGDDGKATALYEESLALRRELGNKHGLAECLEGLAGVAVAQQHLEHAARLLGAAQTLREASGAPLSPRERVRYDRNMSAVRAGLGEAAFASAWATGQVASLEHVITPG